MKLGPKCETCDCRQSYFEALLASRRRGIKCASCKTILKEEAMTASLRFGLAILFSGLVTTYGRFEFGLTRIELAFVGLLAALVVWLLSIPFTRLRVSQSG